MDSPPPPTDPWTAPTEYPTAPIDSPTPPDLPPPTPVISVGDPGPVSEPLPISTPPLVASPVPETSTWIMMMIGFGIMVVACRKRDFHLIKQAFVGTFYKLIKKSFSSLHSLVTCRMTIWAMAMLKSGDHNPQVRSGYYAIAWCRRIALMVLGGGNAIISHAPKAMVARSRGHSI